MKHPHGHNPTALLSAVTVLSFLLASAGCSQNSDRSQVEPYLDFLYSYMLPDDDLLHTRDWWESNVLKTLEVRERMGWDVPEREFRHFVLPLRAHMETIDDFRLTYADTLCTLAEGMSMADAALEMNHWCKQQAAYDESRRTDDTPTGTVLTGGGTCVELSVLLVCALRAIGIPARLVSAIWPHKVGGHAWVEAWVDGQWHYMGGSEPAPVLDYSWFFDYVPQVMLAPIYVFGDYDGPETILGKTAYTTLISNLSRYAPVKNLSVKITDAEGRPLAGVMTFFLVGTGEEKKTIHSTSSDEEGTVHLETGLGDCIVVAVNGSLGGVTKVGADETTATIAVRLTPAEAGAAVTSMKLMPPPHGIIPGTPEDTTGFGSPDWRSLQDDSIRVARRGI